MNETRDPWNEPNESENIKFLTLFREPHSPLSMLFYKPSHILFMTSLVLSTVTAISASSWLLLWIMIELNLISFVPVLLSSKLLSQIEASTKYFLAQAVGSSIVLLSACLSSCQTGFLINSISFPLLITGLAIKMGFPPIHFWMPQVMEGISWINCIILSTWQKLIPIFIVLTLINLLSMQVTNTVLIAAALVGSIGGLNQTHLRPLLAFSSISHMSWIFATALISKSMSFLYLLCYIFISVSVMWSIHGSRLVSSKTSESIVSSNPSIHWQTFVILLSLGGLPPLLGFFPKWISMEGLCSQILFFLTLSLLTRALINLFFYLRLIFNFSIIKASFLSSIKKSYSIKMRIATATLPLGPYIFYLITYAMNLLNKP